MHFTCQLIVFCFPAFVLAHVILYFIDKKEAEKLNADLARFQEKQLNRSPIHE